MVDFTGLSIKEIKFHLRSDKLKIIIDEGKLVTPLLTILEEVVSPTNANQPVIKHNQDEKQQE